MRMHFDSSVPIWEQLQRTSSRRKCGRKHEHRIGPTRQKAETPRNVKVEAAWRKYHEQVSLYFQGFRDTHPEKPRNTR